MIRPFELPDRAEWIEPDESWKTHPAFAGGNYGCDCNRHLFFLRAAGEPDDAEDPPCPHGKYVIVAPDWLMD